MKTFSVQESAVKTHYDVLNKIGNLGPTPASGFLRAAYSNEETAAMKYIEQCALALGAESSWDAVGNLALSWPGLRPEFVETGSHLDTVPNGGNFDGAAGVVAGLLAIQAVLAADVPLKAGFRLRVWRCEESGTFNSGNTGSYAAMGKLNPKQLTNHFRGLSLASAMESQNVDPALVRKQRRTISHAELDSIRAHIELHIEQGNLLEKLQVDLGIVTSIRAARRYRVTLSGEFDHSGATPMGVEFRSDVNLALGYIMVRLDERGAERLAEGADLVQTVGVINSSRDQNETDPQVYENAISKVSGFVYFCLEVRSSHRKTLESHSAEAEKIILEVAARFRVKARVDLISASQPLEELDSTIQEVLDKSAQDLGISHMRMPSGAAHDCAILGAESKTNGRNIPVGMLFIPCRGGKSHSPEEFASNAAIAKGAAALAGALYSLAKD